MERTTLHPSIMKRQYSVGAQRQPPRDILLQFMERATGIDPSAKLEARWLYELAEDIIVDNLADNRPLKDFEHPADWSGKDAVFRVLYEDGDVVCTDGTVSAVVCKGVVQDPKTMANGYYVEFPWSVARATIRHETDTRFKDNCQVFFARVGIADAGKRTPQDLAMSQLPCIQRCVGSLLSGSSPSKMRDLRDQRS